jgi:hypothetical protein
MDSVKDAHSNTPIIIDLIKNPQWCESFYWLALWDATSFWLVFLVLDEFH